MNLADPLGPATQAAASLHPGERLLWAAYGRVVNYHIRGLTPLGRPERSALRKLGSGVAGFAGDAVDAMLGGGDDSGPDRPPPPQVVAFGEREGVLAHTFLRELTPAGPAGRLWALTSSRLVVLHRFVPPEPEPAPPAEKSFVAKAVGFGKGLAKAGKDIAGIITDRTKTYGDNREGEPVPRHEMTVAAELPAARVAGVATARHGGKLRGRPCLRMSLVDGSGLDFLFDVEDPAMFSWLLARTNGAG
ncbi:hypothetical protein [Amycolatopsis samaneae]|uniref:Uncharacterized protein n=1 Tax=Amycolatopsis samaneae TaxID=664691 RepID=A0ABW5GHQ3_9PSEU